MLESLCHLKINKVMDKEIYHNDQRSSPMNFCCNWVRLWRLFLRLSTSVVQKKFESDIRSLDYASWFSQTHITNSPLEFPEN